MAITPIPGSPGLPSLRPFPDKTGTHTTGDRSSGGEKANEAKPGTPSLAAKQQTERDLSELRTISAQSSLEVRFHTLEGSNVTLIQMVDPATGKVVREFPPERLAQTLAEIRAEAAARLNRRSIDRRV